MRNLNKIFDEIYENRIWGDGTYTPRSGSGSKPENAVTYVNFVKKCLKEYALHSVTDFGHGDWQMWGGYGFEGIAYTGIEVSQFAHEMANRRFANTNRNFILANVMVSKKMIESEMLISKDVLQHLSITNIQELLRLFSNSTFRILILCNDVYVPQSFLGKIRYYGRLRSRLKKALELKNPFFLISQRRNNREIVDGDFRGIDLEEYPFRDEMRHFRLVSKVDYDGPLRDGVKKRIYLFERK